MEGRDKNPEAATALAGHLCHSVHTANRYYDISARERAAPKIRELVDTTLGTGGTLDEQWSISDASADSDPDSEPEEAGDKPTEHPEAEEGKQKSKKSKAKKGKKGKAKKGKSKKGKSRKKGKSKKLKGKKTKKAKATCELESTTTAAREQEEEEEETREVLCIKTPTMYTTKR